MTTELIHISVGELWDKYSILLIKKEKISDISKLIYINSEIKYLYQNMSKYDYYVNKQFIQLKKINTELWNIEDKIRVKELNNEFDNEFIQLARSVYFINDKRAKCKNEINDIYNSSIQEVKDYVKYN